MRHGGHTPASYLAKEYSYCIHTYDNALKRIALHAIDLYLTEVHADYQEVCFKSLHNSKSLEADILHNVKKVHGYFSNSRTCRLPFSFSHFIARAIDALYDRDVVAAIQQIMEGERALSAEQQHNIKINAQKILRDSGKVVSACLDSPGETLLSSSPEFRSALRIDLATLLNTAGQFLGQVDAVDRIEAHGKHAER